MPVIWVFTTRFCAALSVRVLLSRSSPALTLMKPEPEPAWVRTSIFAPLPAAVLIAAASSVSIVNSLASISHFEVDTWVMSPSPARLTTSPDISTDLLAETAAVLVATPFAPAVRNTRPPTFDTLVAVTPEPIFPAMA